MAANIPYLTHAKATKEPIKYRRSSQILVYYAARTIKFTLFFVKTYATLRCD